MATAPRSPKPGKAFRSEATLPASQPPRRRGRPSRADTSQATPTLTREQILTKAIELAKVEPLGEISIIGLARSLGVAPALIHYYIGSRDDLISGVANRHFQDRLARLKPLSGHWKRDLHEDSMQLFALYVEYGGVLRYMMSHNRFRLFQQVVPGEIDYGMRHLDRLAGIFKSGGFPPEKAAVGFHLLSQFVMTSAYAEVSRQLPGRHGAYIRDHVQSSTPQELPGAHYFLDAFCALDSATAFPQGLKLLLDGFEGWLPPKRKR